MTTSGTAMLGTLASLVTGRGAEERPHYRRLYAGILVFFLIFLGIPVALIFGPKSRINEL